MNRFKLTREQRHEVYKAALEYYVNSPRSAYYGLCYAVNECSCYIKRPYIYDRLAQYPELFKHAPKFSERKHYWWPLTDRAIRISVLEQAIEETKPM